MEIDLKGKRRERVERLGARAPFRPDQVTGRVQLRISGEPVTLEVVAPSGPAAVEELLPVFQDLTDLVVRRAEQAAGREGRAVSCRAGCAACCRQLIAVSESEARALARLVHALPEPRRSQVRRRFGEGLARLKAAGLLERLDRAFRAGEDPGGSLGRDYLKLRLDCPFLEDETCSVRADRPLACREYLVTTPPEHCWSPAPETLRRLPLAGSVALAVMAADETATSGGWVPLILALQWALEHPEPAPSRPGPQTVQAVFARLGGDAG